MAAMTRYSVTTTDGTVFVWSGILPGVVVNGVIELDGPALLVCPGGTVVNMAYVVSMVPVG